MRLTRSRILVVKIVVEIIVEVFIDDELVFRFHHEGRYGPLTMDTQINRGNDGQAFGVVCT